MTFLVASSAVFIAWPEVDLFVAGRFFYYDKFVYGDHWLTIALYYGARWFVIGYAVALLIAGGLGWRTTITNSFVVPPRNALVGLGSLIIGPGLLINAVLKEFWGRARPDAMVSFGGSKDFSRAWEMTNQCASNCSFVSGHAAAGFGLICVAYAYRDKPVIYYSLYAGGIIAGLVFGLARMAEGRHFLSDIVISGALTATVSALLYGVVHSNSKPEPQIK